MFQPFRNPLPTRALAPLALSVLFPALLGAVPAEPTPAGNTDAEHVAFFEKKIRPLLSSHCYQCHSADTKASGGLRVDDRNGLLLGGDNGAAVVAGDPANSLLLDRVQHGVK